MTDPMDAATYAAKLRELIAWAEERAETARLGRHMDYFRGAEETFREVANHLRQLSQGAKSDEPA